MNKGSKFTLAAVLLILSSSFAIAEPFFSVLPPLQQSEAYIQFTRRPVSELSKLFCLISRFKACDVDIDYGGGRYRTRYVAPLVAMFLTTHYKKGQSAKEWILSYCHRTIPSGKLIWAILPDGSKHLASDLLLQELDALENNPPASLLD